MIDEKLLKKKYYNHRGGAKSRGLKPLTFLEYRQKIIDAGIDLSQIGKKIGEFQLCRYTDSGDYTASSCRFATFETNQEERLINKAFANGQKKRKSRYKEIERYEERRKERFSEPTLLTVRGLKIVLDEIRENSNIGILDLARKTGMNTGHLHHIVRGESGPTYRTLCRYLDAMGYKIEITRNDEAT